MQSIVFEGAGVNAFSYIGVVRTLEHANYTRNIQNFAGVSSGACIASLMALGYSSYDMEDILRDIKLEEVTQSCIASKIYNLIRGYGLFSRDKTRKKLIQILKTKNVDTYTLHDVFSKTGHTLAIGVSDIHTCQPKYYDTFSTPDTKLVDVLVESIAVPFLFTYEDGYVDGGATDNFPLWIFNDETLFKKSDYKALYALEIPETTTGVRISSPPIENQHPHNIVQYIITIIRMLYYQFDRTPAHYDEQSIIIPINEQEAFEFDISEEKRIRLIKKGQKVARRYLKDKNLIKSSSSSDKDSNSSNSQE